jgi:hypothetical protein
VHLVRDNSFLFCLHYFKATSITLCMSSIFRKLSVSPSQGRMEYYLLCFLKYCLHAVLPLSTWKVMFLVLNRQWIFMYTLEELFFKLLQKLYLYDLASFEVWGRHLLCICTTSCVSMLNVKVVVTFQNWINYFIKMFVIKDSFLS